ncbi:MAG: nitric oxide reductase NorQ protein, partial [Thauera sp.]
MAWRLGKPLITLACNEDMTAADLVGRYLLDAEGTRWHDGPLTTAVRHGAICYLDEVVEARQDTTVVIHPLTDSRRILPLDKKGEIVAAHPDFQLVVSYNPGYQARASSNPPASAVPRSSSTTPRRRPRRTSSPTKRASTACWPCGWSTAC